MIDIHEVVREFVRTELPKEYHNTSLDEIPLDVFNEEQLGERNELIELFEKGEHIP